MQPLDIAFDHESVTPMGQVCDRAHGANQLVKRRLVDEIGPPPCQIIGRSGPRALAGLWKASVFQPSSQYIFHLADRTTAYSLGLTTRTEVRTSGAK